MGDGEREARRQSSSERRRKTKKKKKETEGAKNAIGKEKLTVLSYPEKTFTNHFIKYLHEKERVKEKNKEGKQRVGNV